MEEIVHQVTAALRCVDSNSGRLLTAPKLSATGVRFVRNRRGDHVLVDGPNQPQLTVQVSDPTREYLPRRYVLTLPRDANPANAANANSLFQPALVELFPAPMAQVAAGWAVVRVTVVNAANGAPLPGALVRLRQAANDRLLARTLTDWRGRAVGEALIAAPHVPAITFGPPTVEDEDGAVLVEEVAAMVDVIFDPQAGVSDEQPPDPDDLERRRAQLPSGAQAVMVSAGKSVSVRIALALP